MQNTKPALTIGELQNKYKMPEFYSEFILDKIKGEKTGIEFEGKFKIKTLTLDEEAAYMAIVDSWVFKATNGMSDGISPSVREYLSMKEFLKAAVIEAPDWYWDFRDNMIDMNVLLEVYVKAQKIKEALEAALLQNNKEAIVEKSTDASGNKVA